MLRDVEFFSTKLGKLDGFGDAGDFLAGIVKAKEVKTEAPAEEPEESEEPTEAKDEAKDESNDEAKGDEAPAVEEPAKDEDKS